MDRTGLRNLLPRGTTLPEEAWQSRHRSLLVVLWLHVPGILAFGAYRGSIDHALLEALAVVALALPATLLRGGRALRMACATVGLMMSSGIVVHLSGASSEAHFHFFVMVAAVSLYQSWMPFLLAVGFVVVHHSVVGVLDPSGVFSHQAAVNSPMKWAALHGVFILAESIALLATWRISEAEREETERMALQLRVKELTHRQALEINDTVVQGLTVSSYALQLGDTTMAAAALEQTLESARELVSRLLQDTAAGAPLRAGDLVREAPAVVLHQPA